MNDLTSRALELQHAAHELMYLGMDGEPVYSDTFCRLNKEVLVKSDSLFSAQSSDVEEEANLCLALLMGYNITIYDYGDKEQKKQLILDRIYNVLEERLKNTSSFPIYHSTFQYLTLINALLKFRKYTY